jgi:septin 7
MFNYAQHLLCFFQLKHREDQMRKSLEKLQRDVEDRKKHFESDKFAWEQQNGITFEELRRKNMEALSKE